MRILTFLNVSNRSRMQADSGYIFYNLLSPYFTKQNSFYFASPEPLSDCNCIHINKEFGFNKYEVRFSFDWSKVNWRLLFGFVRICSIYYGLFDCVFRCSVWVVQHQTVAKDNQGDEVL